MQSYSRLSDFEFFAALGIVKRYLWSIELWLHDRNTRIGLILKIRTLVAHHLSSVNWHESRVISVMHHGDLRLWRQLIIVIVLYLNLW